MAKFTNCLQIVNAMPQQDQDALLARLDELQAQGMNPKEAQLQAAIDVLAQVEQAADPESGADAADIRWSPRRGPAPKKTVTAYKLFRVDAKKPGQLFPLFVNANDPVEIGKWLDAEEGPMQGGKVKSKLGPLAYRPGWHAGDLPIATHIGGKSNAALKKPDVRPDNQVWAEVEMAADKDWQTEANKRGTNADGKFVAVRAHITDQIPKNGFYRYKTNPNMTGNWLIGGSMKVNRILSDAEVEAINAAAGTADLPRETPFDAKKYGFDIRKSADRITDTPAFKRWSGGAPVIELGDNHEFRSGEPVVVEALHGTTNDDIEEFKREKANIESDFGAGFYSSNTPEDVALNYANNDGADLSSRIARLAERIEQEDGFDGDYDEAKRIARSRLSGGAPNTMKLYVRFKNPAVSGGKGETVFDYEFDEDGEQESGAVVDFLNAMRELAPEFGVRKRDMDSFASDVLTEAMDNGGVGLSAIKDMLRTEGLDAEMDGEYGDNELVRQALERMGFDGVIDSTGRDRFNLPGMTPDTVHFIAFEPEQIKSATGNNGEFGENRNILKSVDRPQFYSQLQRAIEGVPDRLSNMAAPAWKQWLTANAPKLGVKAEEVEWSGIKDYLDLQGKAKLSKDDLSAYLDESGVKIAEVMLGGVKDFGAMTDAQLAAEYERIRGYKPESYGEPMSREEIIDELEGAAEDDRSDTKYGQYTLPGGENYREVLITLPSSEKPATREQFSVFDENGELISQGMWPPSARTQAKLDANPGWRVERETVPDQNDARRKGLYQSSHWDEPNVLAHIRINDRTDADGNKVLFVEEIQSDWSQEATKKRRNEIKRLVEDGMSKEQAQKSVPMDFGFDGNTPKAPFVANTEGWLNLALKRIAMLAVDGGYDKVAFVNGEQSADRYDLSKQLSRVAYREGRLQGYDNDGALVMSKSVDPEELPEYVGKELGERMAANAKKDAEVRSALRKAIKEDRPEAEVDALRDQLNAIPEEYSGLDLKVGGEGMKTFYDQIVPQALNKLLPKLGGEKLGDVRIPLTTEQSTLDVVGEDGELILRTDYDSQAYATARENPGSRVIKTPSVDSAPAQPGFDVTDKMRETVGQGLPLFSKDRTQTAEFKKWFGDSKVVDAEGKPLVMYTGTSKDKDFTKFNIPKNGAWFTTSPEEASMYAKENDSRDIKYQDGKFVEVNTASRVMPVYLRIENPATLSDEDMQSMRMASNYKKVQGQIFDKLRTQGHDGVDLGGGVWVVIGDAKQIKSAIGNSGQFDPSNPDIRKSADRTQTTEFKRWFGDSKVVDADGKPLVVYRAIVGEWDDKKAAKLNMAWASESADGAAEYAGNEAGANVAPVFMSLQNPADLQSDAKAIKIVEDAGLSVDDLYGLTSSGAAKKGLQAAGYDGIRAYHYGAGEVHYAAFRPEQIKSAIGNNGDFDPANPDIRKSTARKPWFGDLDKLKVSTNYQLGDLLKSSKKLNWWNRTVGTQYNLAQKNPEFKRVFDAVQTFINDVSAYATQAADLAPNILPKLDGIKDVLKKPLSAEDVKALRNPVFGGTLKYMRDENGEIVETDDVQAAGVVFTDEELRDMFGLNDRQIGLYREFRQATDRSLTDLALSDMIRYIGEDGVDIREAVMASSNVDVGAGIIESHLEQLAGENPGREESLNATIEAIRQKAEQANRLMDRGYAPLSRFGQYTVYAVGKNGEQLYFGMFETQRDANKMAREMADQHPDAEITTGTMSQESYKLFSGVTPETLALFGESLGLEESGIDPKSEVFQQYLKLAKTNRSAMKRLIERKGIDGFSEDAGRVLAGFVYSNARQVSTNLHAGEISRSASEIKDGDVKDHAIRLMEYIQNPTEEAQKLKALLFTTFLGGNISSAIVNFTQTATTTFPYLSQFDGTGSVMKRLGDAVKLAARGIRNDDELKQALKRAEDEGVVSPQEVFHLMAQAQGKAQLQTGDGTRVGDALAKTNNFMTKATLAWGRLFSAAEQANRRIAFIAAYKLARDKGMADPFGFAEKAVLETQFSTNKGIRPAWARGAVGGVLFTFKGFTISYLELLGRMLGNGPEGKKAFGLALGTLFLFAGAGGMPFVDDLDDVVDGFAQRVLGKSFDSKQAKKEFFASIFGQTGAEFVMGGLTSLPGAPIDLSGRLGLGNIIPGTGIAPKKSSYQRDAMEIFGPAGSLFSNYAMAVGMLAQGEVGAAAAQAAPLGIQNLIKGMDMAQMGFYRDTKGRKVIDTNGWEAAFKALGFQPQSVKRIQEATSTQQGLIAQNKLRETEIADKMARARVERKPELAQEAREELAEWNRKNPESPIRIDQSQINRRVQQAMMDKARRIEKTAPKEIRQSVARELERAN